VPHRDKDSGVNRAVGVDRHYSRFASNGLDMSIHVGMTLLAPLSAARDKIDIKKVLAFRVNRMMYSRSLMIGIETLV
jgi:hypothetical protein